MGGRVGVGGVGPGGVGVRDFKTTSPRWYASTYLLILSTVGSLK